MTRKELFRTWNKDRIDAYLAAERKGNLEEVPGGWLTNGYFIEKLPFKGEALTSYLCWLAYG